MPTIAELHIAKHQTAIIHNPDTGRPTSAYELQLLQLNNDRLRLKKIQSREAKIELKKTLLPTYQAWIDGVLTSGQGQQDDVFMYLLVWTLDVGNLEQAFAMAQYALHHALVPPEQYKRLTATLIAEEVADTSLKLISTGAKIAPSLVADYLSLVQDFDMPDVVRAKLYKAYGCALEQADPALAIDNLERALQLDAKCGVKKQIENIKRLLKKAHKEHE